MSRNKLTVIEASVANGSQSVYYNETLKLNTHTLQIQIRSDSYRKQCFARIHRWNSEEWKLVHSIPFDNMSTREGLKYLPREATEQDFRADREKLLEMAEAILED